MTCGLIADCLINAPLFDGCRAQLLELIGLFAASEGARTS
jgi:hypothetical protein